jgi:hypothetical protein
VVLDGGGHAQRRFVKAPRGHALAQRHREQARQVDRDRAFGFPVAAAVHAREPEARIAQARCLGHVGLGNAGFPVGGLQARVVERGDAHGRVLRQRRLQQRVDVGLQGLAVGIAAQQARVHACARLCCSSAGIECAFGRDVGAAGQQQAQAQGQRRMP